MGGARVIDVSRSGGAPTAGNVTAGEVDAEGYEMQVLLNSRPPQVLGDLFIRAVEGRGVRGDYVVITLAAARQPVRERSGARPAGHRRLKALRSFRSPAGGDTLPVFGSAAVRTYAGAPGPKSIGEATHDSRDPLRQKR